MGFNSQFINLCVTNGSAGAGFFSSEFELESDSRLAPRDRSNCLMSACNPSTCAEVRIRKYMCKLMHACIRIYTCSYVQYKHIYSYRYIYIHICIHIRVHIREQIIPFHQQNLGTQRRPCTQLMHPCVCVCSTCSSVSTRNIHQADLDQLGNPTFLGQLQLPLSSRWDAATATSAMVKALVKVGVALSPLRSRARIPAHPIETPKSR